MRTLRLFPIAFLAGTHGFALFVPYLTVTVTIFHLVWAHRRWRRRLEVRRRDAERLARRLRPEPAREERSRFDVVGDVVMG